MPRKGYYKKHGYTNDDQRKAIHASFEYGGVHYRSKRAFKRTLTRNFNNLSPEQKKKVKPIIIKNSRPHKKKVEVTGRNWKDINSTIEKETVFKPVEKNGKVVLQESNQSFRVNESTYSEPATGDSHRLVEVEESSRYTPSELEIHYEELGGGAVQVNATKKMKTGETRIVSSTVSTITPPKEKNEKAYYLESKFIKWDNDRTEANRLSTAELKLLGKELEIPTGGGNLKKYQVTMEGRIRKKLALKKLEAKQQLDTRYRTFPQSTKNKFGKIKGKKVENSEEMNRLINEALSGKPRHERAEIDEMELILKNADKKKTG